MANYLRTVFFVFFAALALLGGCAAPGSITPDGRILSPAEMKQMAVEKATAICRNRGEEFLSLQESGGKVVAIHCNGLTPSTALPPPPVTVAQPAPPIYLPPGIGVVSSPREELRSFPCGGFKTRKKIEECELLVKTRLAELVSEEALRRIRMEKDLDEARRRELAHFAEADALQRFREEQEK